ncbi:MAG: NAD(P)/FAD-dependent oxidoreductase [bacterium]|nr:NAD(P)/FAD-dependent oxidoreductase [bacterium]
MAKKSSTGALTKEQHSAQDARYAENHEYDFLVIGTGNSALTVGALLAHAGHTVCLLEAHDIPGGYMQTFQIGDYSFCAQVHYTWGCGPGGKVYEVLKHLGLEKEITFNLYDPDGYDHMALPDGKMVKIPYGFEKLAENIDSAYPGQKANVQKFCGILEQIRDELRTFPERKIRWWELITKGWQFRSLLTYRTRTLQDVFDECHLSKETQAILIANAGDFMAPPEELSIFAYVGLFGGYNTGAYYPTKHFKHYVNGLAEAITQHEGCHIYYETPASKITTDGDRVTGVETANGKRFTAKKYICNMDPQSAVKMIGIEKFPESFQKPLTYDYSPSGMVIYLGLKDIDLRDFGFGRHNVWDLAEWDMNKMWKEQLKGNFEKPWFFISTPSLHTHESGTTPEGGQIMEIATLTDFDSFHDAQQRSYAEYFKMKMALADHLLDLVEKKYVPNLRKHIVTKTIGTPSTNVDFVMATRGNAYGSHMTPQNLGIGRLKATTPFSNFFWCNASSGYAGMYGTTHTGLNLYMDLTGDRFHDPTKTPEDDDLVRSAREAFTQQNDQ